MRQKRPLQIGDVITVQLPSHSPHGREQTGLRPAIVLGLPHLLGKPRYPLVVVAPVTTQTGPWANQSPMLYLPLQAGDGGLTRDCVVLLDQLRSVDANRIDRRIGTLNPQQLAPIMAGLKRIFQFS